MVATGTVRARFDKLTTLCMRLPEVERNVRGDHADFGVRGKVFAYFLNDHHGDGIGSVCCKSQYEAEWRVLVRGRRMAFVARPACGAMSLKDHRLRIRVL